MSLTAQTNATFEASAAGFGTGLEGVLGVQILDTPGNNVVLARTTAGIAEAPPASGNYSTTLTAPDSAGVYTISWDNGTDFATEDLTVVAPIPPTGAAVGDTYGDRIPVGRSDSVAVTFTDSAGDPVDPVGSAATVTITRDDGTVLTSAAAATRDGTGRYSFPLDPAVHTTQLDVLRIQWAATVEGYAQLYTASIEIVGGVYFTVAEARKLKGMSDPAKVATADIVAARTLAEQIIEDACGQAFVPRYERDNVAQAPGATLVLRYPRVRAVRSATIGTSVLTDTQLDAITIERWGALTRTDTLSWSDATAGNVDVVYEHGWDRPPDRIKRAALVLARAQAIQGPLDDRETSRTTEDGTFSLSTPGLRGSVTGYPEVDAAIAQYDLTSTVA